MIIKTFGFQKKFSVNTTFLDETLIMEGELEEGETWEEAVTNGRQRMINLVAAFTGNYKVQPDNTWTPGTDFPEHMKTKVEFGPPPIIDKAFERLEIEIDNADTIEKLQKVKEENPVMPIGIMAQWNAKNKLLKELNNANS